jgi:hypothetical protein
MVSRFLHVKGVADDRPALHLGAPQPQGQIVALGPQRVTLGEERRERRVEDCADAEVADHSRIMILPSVRTTFSRILRDPPGESNTYATGLSS